MGNKPRIGAYGHEHLGFTGLAGYTVVQAWTSVMLLLLLIASFQTFAIAVIGEYVGKIYFETKARPRYIVDQEIGAAPTKA